MSDAAAIDPARALSVWRTYTHRLLALSLLSIALAWPISRFNRSVDGFDPFHVALAWQFAIWGAIDLIFAVTGEFGLSGVSRMTGGVRDAEVMRRREKILGALRFNRWLNAVWVTTGVALLVWGYWAWSPSLVGHGVGVSVQAIGLAIFDRAFHRALTRPRDF